MQICILEIITILGSVNISSRLLISGTVRYPPPQISSLRSFVIFNVNLDLPSMPSCERRGGR